MRERVGQRLAELQAEHRAGEKMLADLDAQRADLEQTLLRISGAIQVLEELLTEAATDLDIEPDADTAVDTAEPGNLTVVAP